MDMDRLSRGMVKRHAARGGLDRNLKKINNHHNVFHMVIDLSIPKFLPREWVQIVVWNWAADKKELTQVADSVEHDAFPEREEYLRAHTTALYKYKQETEVGGIPQTKVTYTVQVDIGGAIPKWVVNRQGVGQLMYVIEHVPTSPTPPTYPPPPPGY
jgi:hypothetical protein